jgi:hypothetical protein
MTAQRRRGRQHALIARAVVALALVVAACGGDDDAVTGPTGTTAVTSAPTTAPAAGAPAGTVTPVVVCVDAQRGAAYFGYTNDGPAPVRIAVGDANRVTLPDGTQLTAQQPDVFAPGEQGVVFWTELLDPASPPTWSLTGADGTTRTAVADASATACPDGQPPLDPPDERVGRVVGTVEVDGDSPGITITVEGIPDASRCSAGASWTSDRAAVSVEAVGGNAEAQEGDDPSVAHLTVQDPSLAASPGFDVAGFASIFVWVDVEDHCTDAAGVTSQAWGASESLRDLSQVGVRLCFGAIDDGYGEVDCAEGPTIGATGGVRSR